jgi:hypothetical protein
MKFLLLPPLIAGQTLMADIRRALSENRLREAAASIVREYGQVGQFLDLSVCDN